MTNDPFSASIIPFEVPEQMRAFAEKGVSQARDSYAKFKDAAESHNGAIEAFFVNASKGASEYSAKMMEFVKANTTSNLDFAQELFGIKSPTEAFELWTGFTRKQIETYTAQTKELGDPEGRDRGGRADQGQRRQDLQDGGLSRHHLRRSRRHPARVEIRPGPCARVLRLQNHVENTPARRGTLQRLGLAKAARCT